MTEPRTSSDPDSGQQPAAWIFGATGVVGSATARRLAGAGWRLILSGRSVEGLEAVEGQLGGADTLWLPGDMTSEAWLAGVRDTAADWLGPAGLSGLVFAAASKPDERRGSWTASEDAFVAHWRLKCGSPVRIIAAMQAELELARGSAVLIGGTSREMLAGAYIATMANACTTLAVTYAGRELIAKGVRVNVVSPGAVEMENGRESEMPAGRRAQPDEVAAAVAFLLGEESRYVSASNFVVDGGLSVSTV